MVPVALAMFTVATDTGFDNFGQPDDAPRRASGVLIVFSPVLVLVFGAIVAAAALVLRLIRHHTFKALLGIAFILGICLGVFFAVNGYALDGLRDAVISFAVFSVAGFVCFGLGAVVWWYCSPWKDA